MKEFEDPEEFDGPEPDFDDFSPEQQARIRAKAQRVMNRIKEEEGTLPRPQKKKRPKIGKEQQIMGKYLLRDMPLFKYEIIVYLMLGMVAFFMYILDKIGFAPGMLSRAIIPVILVPVAIWFIKWIFYMPSKKRVPSLRIYKSGVIELGVEDISKGYITYGSGENSQKKYLAKLNKHTEASTGKPFIITSETQGENLSLIETTKPDMKSQEFNALMEMNTSVTTKTVMNKMLKSIQPTMANPMFLLGVITIAMLGILLAKNFGVFEMIRGG